MAPRNIFAGEHVVLRAIEPEDWTTHHVWNQDSETSRRSFFIPFPTSSAYARQWTETESKKTDDHDSFRFQIGNHDGDMVGSMSTNNCNRRMGTFSYGIGIMEAHRRKGYASEAIILMLRYFFLELRYQKCTTVVYDFNPPSMKLHEKLGFLREGTLRDMIYSAGRHYDMHYYGITRADFAAHHAAYLYELDDEDET